MSLRTTALVAGAIGVLLLAVGLIADAQRPPREVQPDATVDTAVVVYEPEMIAFAGDNRLGFSGDGAIVGLTARPADAEAWLAAYDVTYVTGLPDWERLSTDTAQPQPTVSPSPSTSPSASEPATEPSPTVSPSAEAEQPTVDLLAQGSQDHWREEFRGSKRLSIVASDVPEGEVLVVVSRDGTPLTSVDMTQTRDVQDGWITPLIWWGAFLTVVGIIALILRFIDLRPAQAKGEEWMAKRQKVTDEADPEPGTRRARRANGEHLPEASLRDDDDLPPAPVVTSPRRAATAASAASAPHAESAAEDAAAFGEAGTQAAPASALSPTEPATPATPVTPAEPSEPSSPSSPWHPVTPPEGQERP
ncbi:hypothetical protein [Demequina sp.]|uniref:hypothetical protein n=1 Tax=Demequina sp. TaxID=2050685 RepID=UPI003A8B61C0